jgi:hypothetical protein
MKELIRTTLRTAPIVLLLLFGSAMTSPAQSGKLQLDQLDALTNRASNTLEVKLDENLMQTTVKLFSGKDPDDACHQGTTQERKRHLRKELQFRQGT